MAFCGNKFGKMTDLELLDRWCETCLETPHPMLFRDIQNRGLSTVIDKLPTNVDEAKIQVRFRLKVLYSNIELINRKRKERELLEINKKNVFSINAEIFFQQFSFPFKYDVGEKEVLSGLSENSWGDGRRKNTVIHLLLEEDWTDGRLKRKAGDFLCTSKNGSNGNSWSEQNLHIRHHDGQNQQYMPSVTCKQCLKFLKRYEKSN